MLTIEVHGQFITWPEDFAFTMMKYYRKHDVPFPVHRKSIHNDRDTSAENASPVKPMSSIGFQENRECVFALASNK